MSQTISNRSNDCLFEITQEVAKRENVDPVDLPPLHDSVDSEALTNIVDSSSVDLQIEFEYSGYVIRISGNGSVSIEEYPSTLSE